MTAQVCADAVVACRAEQAMARLASVVGVPSDWSDSAGRLSVTVGPRRPLRLHKRVQARLGKPSRHRWTSVSSLWWTPTGRLARLYPLLHAGLAVTPIDDTSCLLSVVGEYVPPLGRIGAAADRGGLHRIADSTVQDFTARLARTLANDSEEGLS